MSTRIIVGDCVEAMAAMDESSVHAIVTDPPYGLGFMGKAWDNLPPGIPWAKQCLRVLKPGGYLLAFGGTRTSHRLVCAIEDAGFEIRDTIAWLYGQGFPKSLNPGCKCSPGGAVPYDHAESPSQHGMRGLLDADVPSSEGASGGPGSVLLASLSEPSTPARGTVPSARSVREPQRLMEGRSDVLAQGRQLPGDQVCPSAGVGEANGTTGRLPHGASLAHGSDDRTPVDADGGSASPGPQSAQQQSDEPGALANEPGSQTGGGWSPCPWCGQPAGLGTALKPAHEPIVVARKPLDGNVAANVLRHGTGAINVNGCRIGRADGDRTDYGLENGAAAGIGYHGLDGRTPYDASAGRWPANVVLDEGAARLLDEQTSGLASHNGAGCFNGSDVAGYEGGWREGERRGYGDSGGASRFFPTFDARHEDAERRFLYQSKASSTERNAGLDGFEEQQSSKLGAGLRSSVGASAEAHRLSTGTTSSEDRRARNSHPTVKPIALMRWLVRLVTPPGGTVLDCFAGSGTTGCAAALEGFEFVGIEREPEYAAIADARVAWWQRHPDGMELVKRLELEKAQTAAVDAGQGSFFDAGVV